MSEVRSVAQALRDHLRESGESQSQFAARAKVSEPTISRLLRESGQQMRAATLAAIVAALPRSLRKQLQGSPRATPRDVRTVFISSTFLDNEARRRHIIEAIESFPDLKCVAMERFSASARPTVDECLEQAMDADLFLGILAYRYGWIPEGKQVSITELEHDAAQRAGVDRLMFVVDERKMPINLEVDADPMPSRYEMLAKLAAFKQRLSASGITPRTFADDAELIRHVLTGVVAWRERHRLPPIQEAQPAVGPSDAFEGEELRYRDALLAEHRYLRFVGFTSRQRAPMNLEELFVPLLGRARTRLPETAHDEATAKTVREQGESIVSLGDCLREALTQTRRGVVIEAGPGAGKTTHLRRLTFGLLTQGQDILRLESSSDDPPLLPVFLPLRSIRASDFQAGLAAVIARAIPEHAQLDKEFAERLLERGRLLLLIDGLDEAPAALRAAIPTWIREQMKGCPNSYFILTTRPAGYSEDARKVLSDLAIEFAIEPLRDEQISQFIERWYQLVEVVSTEADRAVAAALGLKKAKELIARLAEPALRSMRVMEMTANPLLLTIICLVHRDGSYLPDDAVQLYEEASVVLLESWRRTKGLEVAITADRAMAVLRPLACFLHAEPGRTAATASEITPHIESALRSIGWQGSPSDFLCAIRDESGMLAGLGDDRYGFLHLGFQEYFTALHLHARVAEHALDEDRSEVDRILGELGAHFGESWWREVILLLLKRANPPQLFAPFLRAVAKRDPKVFATEAEMVDACLRDTAIRRAEPFEFALGRLLERREDSEVWRAAVRKCAQCLLYVDVAKFAQLMPALAQLGDAGLLDLIVSATREHHLELPEPLARLHRSVASEVRRLPCGVELVRVPAGSFRMGGSRFGDEQPIREVAVKQFWLARTPVTNAQYQAFVNATGHAAPPSWKKQAFNAPDQPVVEVSWDDAAAFCRWAGLQLPSEAQWEYACRAGSSTEYSFGDKEARLAEYGWYGANSEGRTQAVGQKPSNAFGLHDMHGNVWEWCQDSWIDNYRDAPKDERAREVGSSSARVVRGGSWGDPARHCRSAYRSRWPAAARYGDVGFRPASSSLS